MLLVEGSVIVRVKAMAKTLRVRLEDMRLEDTTLEDCRPWASRAEDTRPWCTCQGLMSRFPEV